MKPGSGELTHIDEHGHVRMVDVSAKQPSARRALASAVVIVGEDVYEQLSRGALAKGDALTTAKIAGIQAAKRTAELIPLCHGLSADFIDVQCDLQPPDRVLIRTEARINAKTGVEMEAMVAASLAALTIYDMCKAIDKSMAIVDICLLEKTGGKSGTYLRPATRK